MSDDHESTPYYRLDPDTVLHSIESLGMLSDGRLLALNSYENRVYQVGIENGEPVVAKFYRPGRWSDEQIQEEHEFSLQLAETEIPVIAPLVIGDATLHHHDDFRFALFRRQGGHAPELDDRDTLTWLGRFLGRIHTVGAAHQFEHRPALTPQRYGEQSLNTLSGGTWLPPQLEEAFATLCGHLMQHVETSWARAGAFEVIRLHGDCHPGNVLWRDGPFFVDLDDCQSGPAIQDLWMLLSGNRDEMQRQFGWLLEGYRQFHRLHPRELHLVEALRTLRMLHHAAWLARRWEDPAFPVAFPWFGEPRYWERLILSLREQLAAMQEPPLEYPEV